MGANDDVRMCERARSVGWWNCQCQRCREHAAANTIATPAAQPAPRGQIADMMHAIAHASQPSAPDGGEQLPVVWLVMYGERVVGWTNAATKEHVRLAEGERLVPAYANQCRSARVDELRTAIADYMYSEGCSCCRNNEAHAINKKRIAELLDVPAQPDGCDDVWFDFSPYRTPG